MAQWIAPENYTLEDLHRICRLLRDPVNGCPWDKVQTHESIRKNFLEETCEVLEAIDAKDSTLLREELGDVLMQVALHTCMEEEAGNFTLEEVCREVCEKLVFRHPHIFGEEEYPGINNWEELKNKEKGRKTLADQVRTVPATLPALMQASKLQKRAAEFFPAWNDTAEAEQALDAAYLEMKKAITAGSGAGAQEAGDFLMAAANALRLAGLDAEEVLSLAVRKKALQLVEDSEQRNSACTDR